MKSKNDIRYCVYMLRFSATGEPFYIGKGLKRRPKQHYSPCNLSKNHSKNDIINNFDTYYTIERDGLTNEEANAYEKELIALWGFENLTNKTRGGSGIVGHTQSAEQRAKTSERQKGVALSLKHRENISKGRKGIKFSESHIANLSIAHIGKVQSPKQRLAVSVANRGYKPHKYDQNLYTFWHSGHGVVVCTQYALRTKYNLNQGHIGSVVNGKRKSTGGWTLL